MTVDQALENIRRQLHLSKETETELLDEIRTHLEDAAAEARARGEDEQAALRSAAQEFGIDEVGAELQQVHAGWESIDAVAATALPVVFALVLRWLAYAPDGSALGWPHLLARPSFWLVAGTALMLPLVIFRRWRMALVGWGIFWLLTVIFVVFPNITQW